MAICVKDIHDARQFKALTGTSQEEFSQMLPIFTLAYEEVRQEQYLIKKSTRHRQPGGGQKGKLPTMELKLFFILYYWKVYPVYDVLGFQFGLDRSKACTNVQALVPVLKRTLKKLGVLPAREFSSVDELRAVFGDIHELLIDATEREHTRSQDDEEQRKMFSGKKKRHTVKNTVIATLNKWLLFLGYTVAGSIHDYTLFKQEFPVPEEADDLGKWFDAFIVWLDLGYFGMKKRYDAEAINMPHKKPRKSKKNPTPTLTEEQKAENRDISQVRVIVEQAISGLKRFNIVTHKFRNHLEDFVDTAALLAAGLWNWKLKCQGVTS